MDGAWVTRPERPKGTKDKLSRPEGPPFRSLDPRGPRLLVVCSFIFCDWQLIICVFSNLYYLRVFQFILFVCLAIEDFPLPKFPIGSKMDLKEKRG